VRQKSRKRRLRKRDKWTKYQLRFRKSKRAASNKIRQWCRENREAM